MMELGLSLAGLPSFLAHFGLAAALTIAFAFIYTGLTPHREWTLIRQGVTAAAVAFGGSLLGFVLPLASAISQSVNIVDAVTWGIVACVVQIIAFVVTRFVFRDLPSKIAQNDMAAATILAAISLAVGVLNAACMVW